MPVLTVRPFVAFVLSTCAAGCERTSSAPADAEPPKPTASVAISPPPPRPLIEGGAPRHHLNLACRALALRGSPSIASDAGLKPLAINDLTDGWVTLAAADTLTVSLPKTGRELSFLGPGTFEPCVTTNEAWLVRGTFQGSRGSGESPGAEQWVVTPFGVIRYGAAIVEIVVEAAEARVRLKAGSATVLPEEGTSWESLSVDATHVVKGAPLGKAAALASADRCTKATAATKTLEDVLALPDAAASPIFGDIAMRANDAHVVGRALCAVAKLRAEPAHK